MTVVVRGGEENEVWTRYSSTGRRRRMCGTGDATSLFCCLLLVGRYSRATTIARRCDVACKSRMCQPLRAVMSEVSCQVAWLLCSVDDLSVPVEIRRRGKGLPKAREGREKTGNHADQNRPRTEIILMTLLNQTSRAALTTHPSMRAVCIPHKYKELFPSHLSSALATNGKHTHKHRSNAE